MTEKYLDTVTYSPNRFTRLLYLMVSLTWKRKHYLETMLEIKG